MKFVLPIFGLFLSFFAPFLVAQEADMQTSQPTIEGIKTALASNTLTDQERVEKLHEIGQLFFDQPDSTVFYLSEALELSKRINDSVLISDTYINFSLVDLFRDNYDNTLKYNDSASQYLNSKNRDHLLNLGVAATLKGIAYNNNEQMDLAFENILRANRFLNEAPVDEVSQNYLVQNYSDLSLIYFNIEEYTNAINSAKQALGKAKSIDATHHQADIYNTLATAYMEQEEYALAEVYLDSSAQAFREMDFAPGLVRAYNDKGKLSLRKGKYNSAKEELGNALELSRSLNNPSLDTSIFLDLQEAYFKNGELTMAKEYLDSAQTAATDLDIPLFRNKIALAKSKILRKERNYTEAIRVLENNIVDMKNENLRESERDSYEELFLLYKETGDAENSLKYFESYSSLKDSLKQELQIGKLNVLRVEHNYNQVLADLEKTETELQLASEAQKRITHRNYFLIGLAALIIVFSVFVFFRQRKLDATRRAVLESKQEILKVKQQALDNKVRFKNKQITDFAIHIAEKNELLEKIKDKLKSIKVTNDRYKEMVHDTMHFINNDIEQNKEKIQLYQQVNETTDSFRAKLDEQYDNLSDKERKVATMLRLGQTSKQIALQLNISAASVDNYRYTLRKKMNIPKGDSLKMFIQNI